MTGCRCCGATLWVVWDPRYPDVCKWCLRFWLPLDPPDMLLPRG